MKNVLLVLAVVLGLSSIVQAKEILSVAFVFDRNTLSISSTERKIVAINYMKMLNRTFKNSGLSSYIAFKKVAVSYRSLSKSGDDLHSLSDRYIDNQSNNKYRNGKPVPNLTLQYFQRYYHADIVIGIVDFPKINNSGISVFIPLKGERIKKKNTNILAYGDYGICFLNYRFRKQKEQPAHEIGHTFGLWHGKKVGSTSKYAIEKYANGFGSTDWAINYGTVMAGRYIAEGEGIDNRFSNPYSHKCGYYADDEVCGNSTANAVKLIKKNAKLYNKRGDWYK